MSIPIWNLLLVTEHSNVTNETSSVIDYIGMISGNPSNIIQWEVLNTADSDHYVVHDGDAKRPLIYDNMEIKLN